MSRQVRTYRSERIGWRNPKGLTFADVGRQGKKQRRYFKDRATYAGPGVQVSAEPRHRRERERNENACVCPECGEHRPHVRGVPCRSVNCPKCGHTMVRDF